MSIRELRRWLRLRCDYCGHRFRRKKDPGHSFGNSDGKVWHGPCINYLTNKAAAEERLEVFALVVELSGLTQRDVTLVAELRTPDDIERAKISNKVFRVFYALERKAVKAEVTP